MNFLKPTGDPPADPAAAALFMRCPHDGPLNVTVRCLSCLSETAVELKALISVLMEAELERRIERAAARLAELESTRLDLPRRPSPR